MWNHPSHIIMRPMFWSALLMSHFPIDVLFKNLWAASSSDIEKLIKTNILQVGWKPVVQCIYWSKMIKTSMFASEKTFFAIKKCYCMDWFRGNLQETIVFSNHQIWFSCTIFPWTTSANHANSKLFPFFPPEKKNLAISCWFIYIYNALLYQKNWPVVCNMSSLGSKPAQNSFFAGHLQLSFPVILFTAFLFQDLEGAVESNDPRDRKNCDHYPAW